MIIIIGANGAGKTTTFRMLINDLRPTSGEIIINGKDIHQTVCFVLSCERSKLVHDVFVFCFRIVILILAFVHSLTG